MLISSVIYRLYYCLCNKEMWKIPKKLMKTITIGDKNLHLFWKSSSISITFLENMIIKKTRKNMASSSL